MKLPTPCTALLALTMFPGCLQCCDKVSGVGQAELLLSIAVVLKVLLLMLHPLQPYN